MYEKYQTEYEHAASSAIQELKKDLDTEGVSRKIQIMWEGNQSLEPNMKQLKTLLAEARKGLDEALTLLKSDSDATRSERPSRILSGMKAIHRFHNELRNGIKTLDIRAKPAAALAVAETERSTAEATLQNAVRDGRDASGLKDRLNEASRVVEASKKTWNWPNPWRALLCKL